MTTPLYFSVRDAATRLGVSKEWVWREIREGRIPAKRYSARTTRIPSDHILTLEKGQR